jgi:hypothetical protein
MAEVTFELCGFSEREKPEAYTATLATANLLFPKRQLPGSEVECDQDQARSHRTYPNVRCERAIRIDHSEQRGKQTMAIHLSSCSRVWALFDAFR